MKKTYNLLILFDRFIADSKTGRRLKKDGTRIHETTIEHYISVRNNLLRFSKEKNFELSLTPYQLNDPVETKSFSQYWKLFYEYFSGYLYMKDCFDNYVGTQFRVIRTFFNYIKNEKGVATGDVQKLFYFRSEEIAIVVLSLEQLKFLISDKDFETTLPEYLQRTKDVFVFGCTVGLRFGDLMKLRKRNLERIGNDIYLSVRSDKTSTHTRVKLPQYAVDILYKYRHLKTLLPVLSNNRLNITIKQLCEKAGWTYEVGKCRERRGIEKQIIKNNKPQRFCDLITTHSMRRTAITTLINMGMPEIMVRKISGHAAMSKDFYRYVNYAQNLIDKETDRIFGSIAAKSPE